MSLHYFNQNSYSSIDLVVMHAVDILGNHNVTSYFQRGRCPVISAGNLNARGLITAPTWQDIVGGGYRHVIYRWKA